MSDKPISATESITNGSAVVLGALEMGCEPLQSSSNTADAGLMF